MTHLHPAVHGWLGALPMHLVAEVAGVRIAIVHGDARSLAGWTYSEEALAQPGALRRLREDFAASRARVIASSHTCLPVAVGLAAGGAACALINNGAAGMPNFHGTRHGVITRISTQSAPHALMARVSGPPTSKRSLFTTTTSGGLTRSLPTGRPEAPRMSRTFRASSKDRNTISPPRCAAQ